MKNKIALIIPYFGKLPAYFPFFLNSIQDKDITVLFFSDIVKPPDCPGNVQWHPYSFSGLNKLFTRKLELITGLLEPYKLCDFKPFYGLVFEDYLSGFDFWGSIDTDIVVGNFSKFITDERLEVIDFYSGIKEYISGSFFLVRNTAYCNNLFKKSRDWQEVAASPKHYSFDECGGHFYDRLKLGESIFTIKTPIQSFTEIVFAEARDGHIKIRFTNEILEPRTAEPVTIENNAVFYRGQEYLLVHFIFFKMKYYFYPKSSIYRLKNYFVSDMGMFEFKPSLLNILFSTNLFVRIKRKIIINLRKLGR